MHITQERFDKNSFLVHGQGVAFLDAGTMPVTANRPSAFILLAFIHKIPLTPRSALCIFPEHIIETTQIVAPVRSMF
jgi:hypothetical protein